MKQEKTMALGRTAAQQRAFDAIEASIVAGGTIPNHDLFRRWVLAQTFKGLQHKKSFDEFVREKGKFYPYQMLKDEFKAQVRLYNSGDTYRWSVRNTFFDYKVASCLVETAISDFTAEKEDAEKRRCTSRKLRLRQVIAKLDAIAFEIRDYADNFVECANSYNKAYDIIRSNKRYLKDKVWFNDRMFMQAYKGAGAYYTLQNLVLFHGKYLINNDGCRVYEQNAIDYMDSYWLPLVKEQRLGWHLFGYMKELLKCYGYTFRGLYSTKTSARP